MNSAATLDRRTILLNESQWFVRAAKQLHGVVRIALLGSITTSKREPKDIDFLVTVEDDLDLAALATLSRRLSGHLQSQSTGADVFLANPQGAYIGRTCPWRECAPGIRRSCDALHCGQRTYLHDDLDTIHLPASVVMSPPVEVWPNKVVRVALPRDMAQWLEGEL